MDQVVTTPTIEQAIAECQTLAKALREFHDREARRSGMERSDNFRAACIDVLIAAASTGFDDGK